VCDDLEREGYAVQPFLIPAASVGAPHQRQRIWFVAHSNDKGRSGEFREIQKENGEISERNNNAEPGNTSDGNATNSGSGGLQTNNTLRESKKQEYITRMGSKNFFANSIGSSKRANEYGSVRQEDGEIGTKGASSIYNAIGSNGDSRIITDSNGIGGRQDDRINNGESNEFDKDGETRNVADSEQFRLEHCEERGNFGESKRETQREGSSFAKQFKANRWAGFPTVSPVCGGDDGLPKELDNITFSKWRKESIKAYGNAIVPQVAYQIFKAICNSEIIKST
jgi:DNA (cytosine-5)-methyltransferase 1